MKKMKKSIVVVAVSIVLGMSSGMSLAGMDKKGSNSGGKASSSESSQSVTQLALADQLAAYGDANNDAVALVLAAKMKKSVGGADKMEAAKSSKGGDDSDKKASANSGTADAMLARAKEMAGDNPTVLAMVRDVEGMKSRGRVKGRVRGHEDRIKARDVDIFRIKFEGEEKAEILIKGDGDTDLDLYVYDNNDNEICTDSDRTDTMYCSWTPAWTGTFRVEIHNLGRVWNAYELFTN